MTYEEALKELKHEIDMMPKEPPNDFVGNENVWFRDHEKIIDAHEIAVEALKKRMSKKPSYSGNNEQDAVYCPNCGFMFGFCDEVHYFSINPSYCEECGQAIDWSE